MKSFIQLWMSSSIGLRRLNKEHQNLIKNPVEYIIAKPLETNLFEWHYVITPPADPYAGGVYHGRLIFPSSYPSKPPAIYMITPSGRFLTNMKLCLSISDYHPESWSPIWHVQTILLGILTFMVGNDSTYGAVEEGVTDDQKRVYAKKSMEFNLKNPQFMKLFGDYDFDQKHSEKTSEDQ